MRKLLFVLFFLVALLPVSAQETISAQEKTKTNYFVSLLAEANNYGRKGISLGGGAAIGFGTGSALGLRFLYVVDNEIVSYFEANIFARYYIFGKDTGFGPFVQFDIGPVIYFDIKERPDRPGYGNITAGFTTGWRFFIKKHFFIEPFLRLGYPYLLGGGIAIGFR